MLRFCCLASGSSGNATLIEATDGLQRTRVLIDCGLGWRQLLQRLAQQQLDIQDIDAVFITHEHGDHVGCAPLLHVRHGIALHTSAGTWQALHQASGHLHTPTAPSPPARDGLMLRIGALGLLPFTVPHDAREPLQLRCTDGDRVLGILTDLGHVTPHALRQLAGCHALLLESNHDPALLATSAYPLFLKRRVAGAHGHLSNAQAAQALAHLQHPGLNIVVAAHLSERNNHPDLVRAALSTTLGCAPQEVLLANRHGLAAGWLTA
ncbi:MAG: MBL fold metallo-hydrolase [Pseudomonadota bacterium]|nr:MBL fold metallo-hydrolase [Pseudomonadota bacterium]